ncbi:acyltransferase [Paenibacillus sp. FJAT-26967]|uniref:acyltransferase n=1 Tax=Paenibacillus sp. FJAT-26967 TaxID=1729690 RepID=UPI000A6A845B|nr:acyltransferase [Paenibacillus sp. FJAT-26967]
MKQQTPTPLGRKMRINEIDIVRAVAIIAVVLIHSTPEAAMYSWQGTVVPDEGSLSQIVMFTLNRLSQFAVPMFILISGLVLFYRYSGNWSFKTAVQFYYKRLWSVVIPYLVWSFIYYIYNPWLAGVPMNLSAGDFLEKIKWADTGYHLYFMIIIFQFYLLFPLLMTFVRYKWFRVSMIPLGLVIQLGFYSYHHWFAEVEHTASLAPTYFAYFMAGGFLGLYYNTFRSKIKSFTAAAFVVMLISGGANIAMYLLNRYQGQMFENTWYVVTMLVYAISTAVVLLGAGNVLLKRLPRISGWLLPLGAYSFGIYLVHPVILSAFKHKISAPGNILSYNLYVLVSFLTALLGSLIAAFLYRKAAQSIKRSKPKSAAGGRVTAGG